MTTPESESAHMTHFLKKLRWLPRTLSETLAAPGHSLAAASKEHAHRLHWLPTPLPPTSPSMGLGVGHFLQEVFTHSQTRYAVHLFTFSLSEQVSGPRSHLNLFFVPSKPCVP